MKFGILLASLFISVLVFCTTGSIFAQESATATAPVVALPEPSLSAAASMSAGTSEPDVLWLWGDIVSADTDKNEVVVKYLDYESDTEKEITIVVDEKTVFENVKSLSELKVQDTVSIDYVALDGKNVAKNISAETPEGIEPVQEESVTTEAADTQAVSQPIVTPEVKTEQPEAPSQPAQ